METTFGSPKGATADFQVAEISHKAWSLENYKPYGDDESLNVMHWHEGTPDLIPHKRHPASLTIALLLGALLTLLPTDSFRRLISSQPTEWPKLIVTGKGWTSDGSGGFAMINGQQIMLNESKSGITLHEISEHLLMVEYKGEVRTLQYKSL